jgi:hypothetical protein
LLAFADHGAEFYSGSGNNPRRAFELASINLANRQVPLGALLADLGEFKEADRVNRPRGSTGGAVARDDRGV